MKITVLGTGDTVGTPKVGCDCAVCREAVANGLQRLRTSILVTHKGKNLLIDTSPDLRQQLLLAGSPHIDAIIWTHGHYDHFMGFPDFYRVQRETLQVYAAQVVLDYCGKIYTFIKHDETILTPFVPVDICGMKVTIFPVEHDSLPTFGVRIEAEGKVFAYTCDTRAELQTESLNQLRDADLLLLDGIFPADVHIKKHMNIAEAEMLAKELRAKDYWYVHMSHKIPWDYPHAAHDMQTWNI
ncbi:MAG TPA: MBL fold metallo-hydrolase [Methanocorpusculum sp.]|nr:MBL fold metallo-hydrolase [Methanocorpusculum sp.]